MNRKPLIAFGALLLFLGILDLATGYHQWIPQITGGIILIALAISVKEQP